MEIITIAFSTFLGAAVALAAERLGRRYDAKLREEAAINNLILDLAAKRAFTVTADWDWAEGEMDRVTDSIHHTRALIREARMALRSRSGALHHLRQMTRACNTFLEWSERGDSERVKVALAQLSLDMADGVAALHASDKKRIFSDRPGSFALHDWAE